jgi:hypothetical protein
MTKVSDPMSAVGKPIPAEGREEAYQAMRDMGWDSGTSMDTVARVASCLERDMPYQAQKIGLENMKSDLTGYYRLIATMLVHVEED